MKTVRTFSEVEVENFTREQEKSLVGFGENRVKISGIYHITYTLPATYFNKSDKGNSDHIYFIILDGEIKKVIKENKQAVILNTIADHQQKPIWKNYISVDKMSKNQKQCKELIDIWNDAMSKI